ncbi:hypothetical protein CAC42_1028 [Sphaceloma murrayae]|uniref:Chromate transporter n=1 Tax=Sphaceloma murrayae TaxID=2082308 RepID=A0A2K1R1S5_9PEZI|nr:hypothetical protein CAC42_1028 [Sphaceloma murrayae]
MPFLQELKKLRQQYLDSGDALAANTRSLPARLLDVSIRTWHLGCTSFGGPAVHIISFRRKFVDGADGGPPWVDGNTFQELLSLCQSTPGPGSTKLLVCLAWIHAGPLSALWVFLLWSLPTALGMLALGLGIQQVDDTLPAIAYAFLSGLNAAIVGIIALAATQLSKKTIQTQLDRVLIIFGACAGLCYSSLWYFPVVIVSGGIVTLAWSHAIKPGVVRAERRRKARKAAREVLDKPPDDEEGDVAESSQSRDVEMRENDPTAPPDSKQQTPLEPEVHDPSPLINRVDTHTYRVPVPVGIALIFLFIAIVLILILTSRLLSSTQRPHEFVANMVLAGSVIFGGGPVLIPLMRDYVVQPGWVSPRDFLIGLAIVQAFPGPNFNFVVYLGVLSMMGTGYSSILGAFLGFMGIFTPGLTVAIGFMSIWNVLRRKEWVLSLLRGVNCTAIGLIFTAVYRIWQIGYLSTERPEGRPLADDPWWVVVAVVAYASSAWLKCPTAGAIVIGGVLGLGWYGAVGSR